MRVSKRRNPRDFIMCKLGALLISALLAVLCFAAPALASYYAPPSNGNGTTLQWYWQIGGGAIQSMTTGTAATANIWDTDYFADAPGLDASHEASGPSSIVQALHATNKYSICYLEVGAYQSNFPDASAFASADYTNGAPNNTAMVGYSNEWWFDLKGFNGWSASNPTTFPGGSSADQAAAANIAAGLAARIHGCKTEGQDALEPDDLDGYNNGTVASPNGTGGGWGMTSADSLGFEQWLAYTAHDDGLAIFQKNDSANAAADVSVFDGMIIEQCNEFADPCGTATVHGDATPYLKADKPVLNAEYTPNETTGAYCPADIAAGITGTLFDVSLGGAIDQPCQTGSGYTYSPGSGGSQVPVNTAVPTISGTATQGQAVTESNGTWTNSPASYGYQWQRGSGGTYTNISGATGQVYTLTSADVGNTIRVQETASNSAGAGAPALSAATATVQAPGPTPVQAPQGSWVGSYGQSGYDLAAAGTGGDVVAMPGVSVGLQQGSRYVWASSTSDVRGLENAAGSSRTAATYYSASSIVVQLGFGSAYSGNLELYAVDFDSGGRSETVTVGNVSASLSNFGQGAWVTFPITEAAGATLTITVTNTGPVNAVLSGIFLGGGGSPLAVPPTPVQAPQGSWVGSYGQSGYDLAAAGTGGDVVAMPGVSVGLQQGSRYVWASSTSDVRGLENAAGSSRTAATYYSASSIVVQLGFGSAYSGNLELYAVDFDSGGRSETVTVGNVSASLSNFGQGAWVTFPITEAAGATLTITVTNTGPVNAVLSGIFLGGGGSPLAVPPTPVQAPQGSWVGSYGQSGYDLAAAGTGGDVVAMPGVSVGLQQGSRYVWASSTSDVRGLENAAGSSRTAATYYSASSIVVQLGFGSAYSGNLELYAVDFDSGGRSETVTVGNVSASLSNFGQGAWVTFPITEAAGATLTITVTNTGPVNAVLSGIFLN